VIVAARLHLAALLLGDRNQNRAAVFTLKCLPKSPPTFPSNDEEVEPK
jgi:hypothetical protein